MDVSFGLDDWSPLHPLCKSKCSHAPMLLGHFVSAWKPITHPTTSSHAREPILPHKESQFLIALSSASFFIHLHYILKSDVFILVQLHTLDVMNLDLIRLS